MKPSELATRGRQLLLAGDQGTGKSTQILTLKGRKFMYIFGQNAIPIAKRLTDEDELSLWLPDPGTLDIFPHSVKKEGKVARASKYDKRRVPDTYDRWAEDFDNKLSEDYFSSFEWLIVDDLTGLYGLNFDAISSIQISAGSLDDRNDYQISGNQLSNVARLLWTAPCNVLAMAHVELRQDNRSKLLEEQLFLPGSARTRVPHNFDSLLTETETSPDGEVKYFVSRQKDKKHKFIRCSFPMAPRVDVTLDFKKPLQVQGLQKILDDAI